MCGARMSASGDEPMEGTANVHQEALAIKNKKKK